MAYISQATCLPPLESKVRWPSRSFQCSWYRVMTFYLKKFNEPTSILRRLIRNIYESGGHCPFICASDGHTYIHVHRQTDRQMRIFVCTVYYILSRTLSLLRVLACLCVRLETFLTKSDESFWGVIRAIINSWLDFAGNLDQDADAGSFRTVHSVDQISRRCGASTLCGLFSCLTVLKMSPRRSLLGLYTIDPRNLLQIRPRRLASLCLRP